MARGSSDWAECRAAFDIFDRDGDGHITAMELATIIDHLGMSWDRTRLRQMIKDVDKDGNGTIEFEEFLQMMKEEEIRKEQEAELLAAFRVFDKGRRGYINSTTMRVILTRLGATPLSNGVDDIIQHVTHGNDKIYYKGVVKTLCQESPTKNH